MFVRSWMTSPVVALPCDAPASHALSLMERRQIRRVPVLFEGRLAGRSSCGFAAGPRRRRRCSPRLRSSGVRILG